MRLVSCGKYFVSMTFCHFDYMSLCRVLRLIGSSTVYDPELFQVMFLELKIFNVVL